MDKRLSLKINIISFLLMILVLIGHSRNISYDKTGDNLVFFIEYYLAEQMTKIVIPIFFFIAAYLFFYDFNINAKDQFLQIKKKLLKRVKSIVIPYLFWCFFWFAVVYCIQLIPSIAHFFNSPIHRMGLWERLWVLYIEPIYYPFWFMREFIFYLLITPLLYWIVKRTKLLIIIFLFILSVFKFSLLTVFDVQIYRLMMLAFYCFGIYCAIYKVNIQFKTSKNLSLFLVLIFLIVSAWNVFIEINYDKNIWYFRLINNVNALIGCLGVWSIYDHLDKKVSFEYKKVYSYGFWVYAIHGIAILYFKDTIVKLLFLNNLQLLLLYFFTIFIFIVVTIYSGILVKKYFPKSYAFVTGNR